MEIFDIETSPGDTPRDMTTRRQPERDKLDDWLDIWAREIPSLDRTTEGVVERIGHLAKDLDRSMEETLLQFGLDRRAFHLLGRLRSYGPPYRRSPGQLASDMRLSSGAMTNRLDRLEEAGLVERLRDPDDRRGVQVELTVAGRQAYEQTTTAQAEKEVLVASALSAREKKDLNALLRRMMITFEDFERAQH